jgi:hypothetical protein
MNYVFTDEYKENMRFYFLNTRNLRHKYFRRYSKMNTKTVVHRWEMNCDFVQQLSLAVI